MVGVAAVRPYDGSWAQGGYHADQSSTSTTPGTQHRTLNCLNGFVEVTTVYSKTSRNMRGGGNGLGRISYRRRHCVGWIEGRAVWWAWWINGVRGAFW
jgi:hypothetical protein